MPILLRMNWPRRGEPMKEETIISEFGTYVHRDLDRMVNGSEGLGVFSYHRSTFNNTGTLIPVHDLEDKKSLGLNLYVFHLFATSRELRDAQRKLGDFFYDPLPEFGDYINFHYLGE